jgi:hypothetical protein
MNATIRFLALVAALAAPTWGTVSAQDSPAPPACGHALVLDNEHVLEGAVTRQGDTFHVRREDGSELTMPAAKTLKVCANLEEAYQYICSRANLHDADEHLRLARWCVLHNLREQGIAEAKTALQMRPSNAEARQLLTTLQSTTSQPASPAPAPPPQPAAETGPLLDVTGECMALFTTKVQPILMNTCASCHATGRGGSFVLVRGSDSGGRKATQVNFTAVVKRICFEQPGASPLLFMAGCAHGGAPTAPLGKGESVPLVTLQGWVSLVVANHPQLAAHGAKAIALPPKGGVETTAVKSQQTEAPAARSLPTNEGNVVSAPAPVARVVELNPAVVPATPEAPKSEVPGGVVQPRTLPLVAAPPVDSRDEFDPMIFNRQLQPKQ